MPNISINDILINAQQEAHRMRHFYTGVEHLFIALLDTPTSMTSMLIREYGLRPEYVIDSIRRKVGKGSKQRLWAGIPQTPRMEAVLAAAQEKALGEGREDIDERDLLVTLFREGDSLPVRVLMALGMDDIDRIIDRIEANDTPTLAPAPHVKIEFSKDIPPEGFPNRAEMFILRRMFYEYPHIRVERRLTGGFTKATVLVVTPIHIDNRQDAAVVVKIGQVDAILDEARRYETHVKTRLPPMTARLEDKPITPEASPLAGIKYTLIAGESQIPQDLRAVLTQWSPEEIGRWLKEELFPVFGRIWWKQNRPFRFQVWREYDWMLPPVLTLEVISDHDNLPPDIPILSMPIRQSRLQSLEYGEVVAVKNFIVQKISHDENKMQLAIGHGTEAAKAYKIEFRNIDILPDTHYRGEVVDYIVGRIWQTRSEQLLQALRTLEPDFDPKADKIPVNLGMIEKLPNPIKSYETLLEDYVNGSLCTIHGDLHPGNIMIGPSQSPFLIDFANTRDGHTIFDWATLETSLLSDVVMASVGDSWASAREVLKEIVYLNGHGNLNGANTPATRALVAIPYIRQIVQQCLEVENQWSEYFIALVFCGLRAITWDTMPKGGRRLMFLVAALSIHELTTRFRANIDIGTNEYDETDINTL